MTLETVLTSLEQAQLVRQIRSGDTTLPVEFGAIYQFKHTLTQEAAYRSLPRRLRQQIHRRVAECYEQLFADRLDEYAAVLAQHYAEAGDSAKAFEYSQRAGDAALRMYATAEAIAHYERALALVATASRPTDEIIHLYTCRGRALELAARFREALSSYQEMESEARDRADVRLELAAIMAQARLYSTVNPCFNLDLARAQAERALGLAIELGDRRAQAEAYWNLMNQARFGGDLFLLAVDYGERAMRLARDAEWPEQLALILNDLADVYFESGQMEQGKAVLQEAHILFRNMNNLPMLADNLVLTSSFYTGIGEFDKALHHFDEALALAERFQNEWVQGFAHAWRGMVWWMLGDYAAAIGDWESGAAFSDRAGFLIGQYVPRILMGMAYAELGDFRRATQEAQAALAMIEQSVSRFTPIAQSLVAYLLTLAGEHEKAADYRRQEKAPDPISGIYTYHYQSLAQIKLALWRGQHVAALALTAPHVALLQKNEMTPMLVDVLLAHGQTLIALSQRDEARAILEQACTYAQEQKLQRSLWQILAALAELAEAPEQALALRAEAVAIVEQIANRLPSPDLRTSFLGLPEVRKVLAS